MTIKTTSFTHRPRVALAQFSFCWWRHNRLLMISQWPDSCDAITWIMISNLLDINFIHGDIHGWWCKKKFYVSCVRPLLLLQPVMVLLFSNSLRFVIALNPLWASDVIFHWWTTTSILVKVCHLFGVRSLSKPVQTYCQLDPWKWTLVKFEWKYEYFH